MKPVFKCEYCKFMGTEEEVKKHEPDCYQNYDMRSCYTCKYKESYFGDKYEETYFGKSPSITFKCNQGVVLPENQIYEHCKYYEKDEQKYIFNNIFNSFKF